MKCSMQRYLLQEVEFEVPDEIVAKAKAGDEEARQAVRDAGISVMPADAPLQWSSTHWLDAEGEEIDSH